DQDPANLNLLADAAGAAFDAGDLKTAGDLIARHAAIEALPSSLLNLSGLIAIKQQRYDDAASIFTDLRERGFDDPVLRFNLAWADAMRGAFRAAFELLDDAAVAASPVAPGLKIQMMHHLGLLEEALAEGETLAQRFPENRTLMGALATLAIDAEKPALA